MLLKCWASVADAVPALKQHWDNALCLQGVQGAGDDTYYQLHGKHEAFTQCWRNVGPASQTVAQHWVSVETTRSVFWLVSTRTNKMAHQFITWHRNSYLSLDPYHFHKHTPFSLSTLLPHKDKKQYMLSKYCILALQKSSRFIGSYMIFIPQLGVHGVLWTTEKHKKKMFFFE